MKMFSRDELEIELSDWDTPTLELARAVRDRFLEYPSFKEFDECSLIQVHDEVLRVARGAAR